MKFKNIFILNIFILILINSKQDYLKKLKINSDYEWTIIGAGPAGIIITAVLLELGINEKSIFWVDPDFKVGRLGEFYSSVPANSNVESIIKFMKMCKVISEINTPSIKNLNNMNPLDFPKLEVIINPLQDITDIFLKKVNYYKGILENLEFTDDLWNISLSENKKIKSKNVILATGSKPRILNFSDDKEIIPLDLALNKDYLNKNLKKDDSVAVFGSAHSAILILKFLVESNINKIINIYRSEFVYAVDMGNWILNNTHGLKGLAAKWAKEFLENEKNYPINLFRFKSENKIEIKNLIKDCNKVIYAVGYEKNDLPEIYVNSNLISTNNFNPENGIIGPRLFGIGLAFPGEYVNQNGQTEKLIGINSFMLYAQSMAPFWINQRKINDLKLMLNELKEFINIEIL